MATTLFVDLVTLTAAAWFNDTDTATYAGLTGVSGTNTITAGGPASLSAYAVRQRWLLVPAATNTGATTLNITPSGGSALGARNIFWNGVACIGGELKSGVPAVLVDDGTRLHIVGGFPTNQQTSTIGYVFDGGGSVLTTGVKGDLSIPFACTINSVRLLADQSGSIVIDIWKDTYANYPPTVADTITASAKPTITTATKSEDTTLTGWTTAIAVGDTLRFNIDSIMTLTRVTLILKVTKT